MYCLKKRVIGEKNIPVRQIHVPSRVSNVIKLTGNTNNCKSTKVELIEQPEDSLMVFLNLYYWGCSSDYLAIKCMWCEMIWNNYISYMAARSSISGVHRTQCANLFTGWTYETLLFLLEIRKSYFCFVLEHHTRWGSWSPYPADTSYNVC